MLIQVYHLDPPVFAILELIVSFVSILTRTIIRNAIDKLGERFVLSLETVVLFITCMGYAFAADIFSPVIAVVIITSYYIIDNSMSVVEMARSTYCQENSCTAKAKAAQLVYMLIY